MNFNSMDHSVHQGGAPEWLLYSLAALFLCGACFYLYRIVFYKRVKAHYGYIDIENEIGHGLCMAGMVTMLAPVLLPISFGTWAWILGFGAGWFALRTFTWGLKLPRNWYVWDLIHVGMLGFMSLMFSGIALPVTLTYAVGAFWAFFTGYAAYWSYMIRRDGRPAGFLEFGSDSAHIAMGVAMFIMTLWPTVLMPANGMDGMMNAPVEVAPPTNGVIVVTDADFQTEVLDAHQPVVVLVFGGCENCAAEVPIFDGLASKYAGKVKFVRIRKEDAPDACRKLGVKDCPAFILLNGAVRSQLLDKQVDESMLRKFLEEALSKR